MSRLPRKRHAVRRLTAGLASLLAAASLPASPILSEFMPANTRTLADEDGDFPDWIEVSNPGGPAIDLAGWTLTDDPSTPARWVFPHLMLPADGYLVVFASGKDRRSDPSHLHANFRLDAGGGYLALFPPGSTTPATAFAPYPRLRGDVAFGIAERRTLLQLAADVAPRILVPGSAAALPADWNQPDFTPGADWLTGQAPAAIGFDANPGAGGGALTNLARTGNPAPKATQSSTLAGFVASLGIDGDTGNFTHTLGTDTQAAWTLDLGRTALIQSVTLHNRDDCCGSRLRDVTVEVLAADQSVTYASPLLNPRNTGFVYPNGPDHLDVHPPTPVAGQFVRVRRQADPTLVGTGGQGNGDEAAVLSLGEVVVQGQDASGYATLVRTDIRSPMQGRNASAFVRLAFTVPDPSQLADLTLALRHDDGFVAYLNGAEVARRGAPASATWNSTATAKRTVASVLQWTSIDLTTALPRLRAGTNVLAFQVLNASIDDPNLLLEPRLTATRRETAQDVQLLRPTPGAPNVSDFYRGDVADTKFSVDRGFFDAPFTLAVTSATPSATIYLSFNADEPAPGKGVRYTGPITITNTTVVRARAFREDWRPTDVDTMTYVFLADVPSQATNWARTRVPPPGFPASWGANAVDYGMDPAVVARYTPAEWKEALTQLPTLSVVTEMGNLFDPATGIYANASGHGEEWERPASVELLEPAEAVPGRFQQNCGLRIRGGYSRNPQFVKHSFRVFFRSEYGAAKLSYPLFGDAGADAFDTFDLRTSQNYSWSGGDTHETLVREEFCEETLGALGQPHRRNRPTHLYLNGQYWGIYEFDERPEASYGATYLGGPKAGYDVVKCGNHVAGFVTEATDGDLVAWSDLWKGTRALATDAGNANYFRVLGCRPDGSRDPQTPVLLDVDNLVDYMLEIFYSGDGDATLSSFLGNNRPNNWFGMRDRTNPDVGFRFFNSDCEHTLGAPSSQVDRTGPFGGSNEGDFAYSNPQWMHEALLRNVEYRLRFADHVQRHLFDGGALTPEAATNRFNARAALIDKAIRAYSARWGSVSLGEAAWRSELNTILRTWFPSRTRIVLDQLRKDGLYPTTEAPRFGHAAGEVPAGFQLEVTHANAVGDIYLTTDGSDPRRVGGGIAPTALRYTASLRLDRTTDVRARVLSGTTWSALRQAVFRPAQDLSTLVLSEVMYHPAGTPTVDGDAFEFIELKNAGGLALELGGLQVSGGIAFTFPIGTRLAAGAFLVLVRDPVRFAERYPKVPIAGTYVGKLSNGGESLRVSDASGRVLVGLTYGTRGAWPVIADGGGYSLVPAEADRNGPIDDPGTPWRASGLPGGSPGADDPNSLPARVELGVHRVDRTDAGVTITFEARAGRAYTVQGRESLESGAWEVVGRIPVQPTTRTETVQDAPGTPQRYYRLTTP